ncbi:7-cyano-7-deazaguanine synthase [Caballeronia sp. 15715]|uniref:7-cyano-7-deazaguanine synthase n=1 Tax=Caballeronia sp. 15715 TaxID=3391030 RepID=UPI0039E21C24
MGPRPKTTVLLSGGIDSAACAHFVCTLGQDVDAVFLDYGQAAATAEHHAALRLAAHLDLPLRTFAVSGPQQFGAGELLGRNAFLIFSTLFLTGGQSSALALGLHAGTPYYDCSSVFVSSISKLVAEHTDGRISVVAPFIEWTKQEVYEYFLTARIPIGFTYSCEAGTEPVCGVCASCLDRRALQC